MSRPRLLAAAALLAAALLVPAPADARVTVSVEIAWGGVVVGGVGFFVYLAGSWEIPLAGREVPTALLEVHDGRARWGLPLPRPALGAAGEPDAPPGRPVLDLLRWRF